HQASADLARVGRSAVRAPPRKGRSSRASKDMARRVYLVAARVTAEARARPAPSPRGKELTRDEPGRACDDGGVANGAPNEGSASHATIARSNQMPKVHHLVFTFLLVGLVAACDDGAKGGDPLDGEVVPDASGECIDEIGASCDAPEDCCSGHCWGGVCTVGVGECTALTNACEDGLECCLGNCQGGECVSPVGECAELGGACKESWECCGNHCASGKCVEPEGSCAAIDEACETASDCCNGSCNGDVCTVVFASCGFGGAN